MSGDRRPARSVLFLQAKPGQRDALVDVFRRLDVPGHALQQEGCLSVEVQVAPDEDGPVLVTALWTQRAAYDGWLANPWREYSGSELAPFLDGEYSGVVYDVVLAGGDVSAVAAGAPQVATETIGSDARGERPESSADLHSCHPDEGGISSQVAYVCGRPRFLAAARNDTSRTAL